MNLQNSKTILTAIGVIVVSSLIGIGLGTAAMRSFANTSQQKKGARAEPGTAVSGQKPKDENGVLTYPNAAEPQPRGIVTRARRTLRDS